MRDSLTRQTSVHKENMLGLIENNAKDKETIRQKIKSSIDPLNREDHHTDSVNIESRIISAGTGNSDDTIIIDKKQ